MLHDAPVAGLAKLQCGIDRVGEWRLWAGRVYAVVPAKGI